MEVFVGQIQLFAFNFAPRGWVLCEGQVLSTMQYHTLFTLLGTNFGGDGRVTFGLPNLKGKEPVPNLHYYIATEGLYPTRQ